MKITLSNLSTAEQIVLNLSLGTPQASKIPSRSALWFILIKYEQISNEERISAIILTHSASGIIGSYCPAMSKSWNKNTGQKTKIDH